MPWHSEKSDQCPADKPWAVVKNDTGEKVACHETKESADAQVAALYANVPDARSLQALERLGAEREIRSATFQPLDVADDGSWFEGYAAVFDEDAHFELPDGTAVSESVQRGAFRKALASGENVPMLYHHLDTHPPLATTQGGTLHLQEDTKGLRTRADIAKGYIGDAVRELVRRGDIPGMSWGFIAGPGNSQFERRKDGTIHRTLLGFKRILDVSPTWDPSYRGTEAQFRSQVYGGMLLPGEAQLIVPGSSPQGNEEGTPEGDEELVPTGTEEESEARAVTIRSIEQMRRQLSFMVITDGGIEDA